MPNCRLSKEKRKKIWGAMQLALLVDRLTTGTMNEAFKIANAIREKYEKEGYIVEEINIRKK